MLKIFKMLKPDGLFCFTCATLRTTPQDSFGTIGDLDDMKNYYKNLTILDINQVLNLNQSFSSWDSYYNQQTNDLYFIGIKKGESNIVLPKYEERFVECTSKIVL